MVVPRRPVRALLAALAVLAVVLPATPQTREHRFLGPDLGVVPLTDDEIVEFLQTAEVVERERIRVGINGIDRLVLEKDGIRLRAGFREVDTRKARARVGGASYFEFRDSYLFEPAAYRLSLALGIPNVPPAVLRRIRGVAGSLQIWVEDIFEDPNQAHPDNSMAWVHQLWNMTFFDSLIYNVDRNPGNILVDHRYRLWMIDHTRAFQQQSNPFELERVGHVGRDVWERFQALERSDYDEIFGGLLKASQIGSFMNRRDKLIEHINTLIAERTEGAVLF
ncbi:MAG: hypothetical protein IH849_13795 [Acidobacteria bacterium]|nr:hypothetical protein [Acidobacteriota bacterium]